MGNLNTMCKKQSEQEGRILPEIEEETAEKKEEKEETAERKEEKAIQAFVEELLEKDHRNSKLIPDMVEKDMYEKIIYKLLFLLKESQIHILNHKITLNVTPLETKKYEDK